MEKEYTLSKFSKIFYSCGVLAILGFLVFMLTKTSNSDSTEILLTLFFGVPTILLALYTVKRKVIVSMAGVTVQGMFARKSLDSNRIKGFRLAEKTIVIEPVDRSDKRLLINDYTALGELEDMIKTLSLYYPDVDHLERQQEMKVLLTDDNLGASEVERNDFINNAKKQAQAYNIGGGALFISMFFKFPDRVMCYVAFFYGLIGIFLLFRNRGTIKFFTKRNSPLLSIYMGLFIASMMTMISAIMCYHLVSYSNIWTPFLLLSAVICGAVAYRGYAKNSGSAQVFILILFSLFYGYGTVLFLNCELDRSLPKTNEVAVYNRFISGGVPYITLIKWGPIDETKDIKLTKSDFEKVQKGQAVKVLLRKGAFSIPWYKVELTPQVPAGSGNGNSPNPR